MAYPAIETYLSDHLAGATAGVNLVEIAVDEHRSDELADFFGALASEIRADFATLEQLMDAMDVERSATKSALAEVGSKLAKPKFTSGDDPELGTFITLETLSIGVEGKQCMWKALKTVADGYPALQELDLDALIERAQSQRDRIESKRLEMAPLALVHTVNV